MKLTDEQRVHLMELAICTAYQTPQTAALVKLGLATTGKSKFCEWAKITTKGQELVASWTPEQRVALEGAVINLMVAPALARMEKSGKKPGRGRRAAPGKPLAVKERPTSPNACREARVADRLATVPPAIPPDNSNSFRPHESVESGATQTHPRSDGGAAAPTQPDPLRGAAPRTRRTAAKKVGRVVSPYSTTSTKPPEVPLKAGAASPNAVRVTNGKKVTYYPLTQFGKISNGETQRCFTTNKLFRTYPVGTSTANDQLFQ